MAAPLTLEALIDFLLQAPLFQALEPEELSVVVQRMEVEYVDAGGAVFEQGDPGDAWFVVYEGEVLVTRRATGGERLIATLGVAESFGEMSLLDGERRSATVRARSDLTVLRLPRLAFTQLLREGRMGAHKLVTQMALVLVRRQRSLTEKLLSLTETPDREELLASLLPVVDRQALEG
ncbi:MAG: cyclic nucleotide-binding domain-containing protein [Deltaproteobacteria bacterium]|nr:cyclic nucleotide-binding domain-containing protein [Deltaproteobacteria bacterium]